MNYKNLIIVLLVFLAAWLLINKIPRVEKIKYITETKYEQKVDTILVENVKIRSKLVPYYDTIVTIREKLVYFRYNKDTVNLVKWQDSLIKNQDSIITWQDTLITNLDTVIFNQAKAIDVYKDSIVDLNIDLTQTNKKLRRSRFIQAGLALFGLGIAIK